MWVIAVLLPISFALFLLARIPRTQARFWVLHLLGVGVWFAALLVSMRRDHSEPIVMVGFLMIFVALSELIAIPIASSRVAPPSVLVKSIDRGWIWYVVVLCLWVAFVAFWLCTEGFDRPWLSVHMGLVTLWMIMMGILGLFSVTEIGVDGIRLNGRLRPWQKYESFSWKQEAEDSMELTLVADSSVCPTTRFLVRPEDREAVHGLLKSALKDLSAIPVNS